MNSAATKKMYSIFGGYDGIKAEPETISKLYDEFRGDGFMPNLIPYLKIQQATFDVQKVTQPQLINTNMHCTITIMPERVDIEGEGNLPQETVCGYFNRIIELFRLGVSRIALNSMTEVTELTEAERSAVLSRLAPPASYDTDGMPIELATHHLSRRMMDSIGEDLNIGCNMSGIMEISEDSTALLTGWRIATDLNTRSENTRQRFDIESIRAFFSSANVIDQEIVEHIEGVIHGL